MTLPPWSNYFTLNNLPNEDLKIVADLIGLQATITLICELPGTVISIPKNATLQARKDYIIKNYDGTKKSRMDLAKKCNVSENYIYNIIRCRYREH